MLSLNVHFFHCLTPDSQGLLLSEATLDGPHGEDGHIQPHHQAHALPCGQEELEGPGLPVSDGCQAHHPP